ncbi:MAG: pseudouridine synthase [Solirubrobacteraceae bacterium]
MRLGKHLAHAGVASRRASEALIAQGRVTVAGEVVRDPARDVDETVEIVVDGVPLAGAQERVVYAVHKPVGVLSTADDPFGRPIVVGLVRGEHRRLYPVGRLDLDSAGLILLTNDGELAHALTHPSFEVPKTYVVEVEGAVSDEAISRLASGVELEDGLTAPAQARRLASEAPAQVWRGVSKAPAHARRRVGRRPPARREQLEITIREGRNRQIRRMCEAVGHPVMSLTRVAFGPLLLGGLPAGASRRLDGGEVQALRDASAEGSPARRRGAASRSHSALEESPR